MELKPWEIMVLRVHSLADAPLTWEVLGLKIALEWDYATCRPKPPVKFGAESDNRYLVSAADLGLSVRTCADYKNNLELYNAQLEHDRLHGRPWRFDSKTMVWVPPPHEEIAAATARMEQLKATIAETGATIQAAITEHFPAWLASNATA